MGPCIQHITTISTVRSRRSRYVDIVAAFLDDAAEAAPPWSIEL